MPHFFVTVNKRKPRRRARSIGRRPARSCAPCGSGAGRRPRNSGLSSTPNVARAPAPRSGAVTRTALRPWALRAATPRRLVAIRARKAVAALANELLVERPLRLSPVARRGRSAGPSAGSLTDVSQKYCQRPFQAVHRCSALAEGGREVTRPNGPVPCRSAEKSVVLTRHQSQGGWCPPRGRRV